MKAFVHKSISVPFIFFFFLQQMLSFPYFLYVVPVRGILSLQITDREHLIGNNRSERVSMRILPLAPLNVKL